MVNNFSRKIIRSVIVGTLLLTVFVGSSYAADTVLSTDNTNPNAIITMTSNVISTYKVPKIVAKPRPLLLQTFLHDVCERVGQGIPSVYKQMIVKRPSVKKDDTMYTALQKCVYLGILEPTSRINNLQTPVNGDFVKDFLWKKFSLSLPTDLGAETLTQNFWNDEIRYRIPTFYGIQRLLQLSSRWTNTSYESPIIQSPYFWILANVFSTLKNDYHYLSWSINEEDVTYGAVKWMIESLHDPYSVYFPAEQAVDFFNSIQWEIFGIGVYVDAVDGYFTILSAIPDSPAAKAWLQPWDRVIMVDDWKVPTTFTLGDVTKRIKWPVWSTVKLTINRGGSLTVYSIQRAKVSTPLLQTVYKNNSIIFTISSFGKWLDYEFEQQVDTHKDDIKKAKNIIIDLRSNGGWYTDVALRIMQNFVASGNILIQNEWWQGNEVIVSQATTVSPFTGKNIYIIINRGTASASEQLAGVIKEYYPTAKLVWEKSFGKWSMQTIMWLPNAGSVKYTVALWYYGASRTSVEKIWLTPDILLQDDPKTSQDEILETVLHY